MTAETPASPPSRRRRRWAGEGSLTHPSPTGFALVTPALAFVVVFVLAPLAFAVYISLTNWPLIGSYHFVGLRNYANIVHDDRFLRAVVYTLIYTAIVTLPILVVGYLMAVVVRANRRGSGILRTIFFLPYVIGLSTLSFMLVLEAQPGSGAVNLFLKALGITDGSTAWLVNGPLATGLICGARDLGRLRADHAAARLRHAGHLARHLRVGGDRRCVVVATRAQHHDSHAATPDRDEPDHFGHRVVPRVHPILHPDPRRSRLADHTDRHEHLPARVRAAAGRSSDR
jgi:hypothetical protein